MPRGATRMRSAAGKINLIGARVKQQREAAAMTQDALCARLAYVTEGAWIPDRCDIYKIEIGRRSVYDLELVALAKALGRTTSWLLGEDSQA